MIRDFNVLHCDQVKRILYEEEEGSTDSSHPESASSEDEDIFEETAQVYTQTHTFIGFLLKKSSYFPFFTETRTDLRGFSELCTLQCNRVNV